MPEFSSSLSVLERAAGGDAEVVIPLFGLTYAYSTDVAMFVAQGPIADRTRQIRRMQRRSCRFASLM